MYYPFVLESDPWVDQNGQGQHLLTVFFSISFNYLPYLDEAADDIIASGSLLTIGIDAAKRSLNEEKQLKFEITIKSPKSLKLEKDCEPVSDCE